LSIPAKDRADAAICTAFKISENVFVRPSWWDALTEDGRQFLLERRGEGMPFEPQPDAPLANFKTGISSASVTGILSSLPGNALFS
jgi:hypothetical protein